MKHKQQLADVTNLQGHLALLVAEPIVHERFYDSVGLYLAALHVDANQWDNGKPEWQRVRPQGFQVGGVA